MMQIILLITHFKTTQSKEWVDFIDGFEYFKFNLRFLNPILNFYNLIQSKEINVPSRMYYLLLENKSALICFFNYLIILIPVSALKLALTLFERFWKNKISQEVQIQESKLQILIRVISTLFKICWVYVCISSVIYL